MLAGRMDLYPNTPHVFHGDSGHQPISDPRAVYEQVKQEYGDKFRIAVSEPLGFENTFAILIRGADARSLKLKKISDVARMLLVGAPALGRTSNRGPTLSWLSKATASTSVTCARWIYR
jgi:glycine betaine/choline ABC-type transport system substrate-binding protein